MSARARILALAFACCFSLGAAAQEAPAKRDDLDVTMQIIVDPNAKLPDEVVRRIPLPAPRAADSARPSEAQSDRADKRPERADTAQSERVDTRPERVDEARELGREAAERATERAREAQEQREDARNANAERGKDKDKDKDEDRDRDRPTPPGPPSRP